MEGFLSGAATFPRALALLRQHPRLHRLVVVPAAVSAAVGALLYVALLVTGFRLADRYLGDLSGFGAAVQVAVQFVLAVALLLIVGFAAVRLGVVLGSPWYGRLSEDVEELAVGTAPDAEPLTAAGMVRDLRRAMAFELRKLAVVAVAGGALLLAGVLPVIGQVVAAGGGAALAAFVACLDGFDPALERRRASFGEKVGFVRANLPASLGFGVTAAALLALPLLNLLSIPLIVVAGTLFFCDRLQTGSA